MKDSKHRKNVRMGVSKDTELAALEHKQRQQAVAKDRMKQLDVGTPKVRIYKNGKFTGTGNFNTVPQHRILTIAQAKEIAEANALTLDSKSLDAVLKQYGYSAIMQGTDRVRMLGD